MSHISDATDALCSALGHCFGGYDDSRRVSTALTAPMADVAVVNFSIVARGIEVYGSLSIVVDVIDWSGICFVSDFSPSSTRWLEHGPIRLRVSEFAREFAAACAAVPGIARICPSESSIEAGFHFDLEAR